MFIFYLYDDKKIRIYLMRNQSWKWFGIYWNSADIMHHHI